MPTLPTMPTLPKKIHPIHPIHPIIAYRVAVSALLAALVTVGVVYWLQADSVKIAVSARSEAAYQRRRADTAEARLRNSEQRAARAEKRLLSIERGGVIPQGTRRAVAQEVANGWTILTPEMDGAAPEVKADLSDAKARESIVGGAASDANAGKAGKE